MPTIEKKSWSGADKSRNVDWTHPNEGWEVFKEVLDTFIATAIDDIAQDNTGENVEWLEIDQEGPHGMVLVTPTQDGPFGDRETRLTYSLFAKLLQDEFDNLPSEADETVFQELSLRFWGLIEVCLTSERACIALAKARTVHRMRLAAYSFDPREGMHYLPNLVDPEFSKQYQHYLANRGY